MPPGQRYGDARRHILAAFLGCIPVFSVPDGVPTLAELLPWHQMAVEASSVEAIASLPERLRSIPTTTRQAMRQRLACAARFLWYASVYGACDEGASRGGQDAFDGLTAILAARLSRQSGTTAAAAAGRSTTPADPASLALARLWNVSCRN